jgi:hypothetical protein
VAKKARFGDWTKGEVRETTTFCVSYSVAFSDGTKSTSGTIKCVASSKEEAGEKCVRKLKRRDSRARVQIRRIWEPGMTPGGLYLPAGVEWVDDEVEGKGKTSR